MSAITFPHGFPPHTPSFAEDNYGEQSYAMLGSSTSGFQMNPLSVHPPRTPRTSVVGSSIPASAPAAPGERPGFFTTDEDDTDERSADIELEDVKPKRAARPARELNVRREDIWREILKTSNGRDKALKIIQYTLKVYLLFHNTLAARTSLGASRPWQTELLRRLSSTTAGLSLARKCLILFNWLPPLTTILADNAASVELGSGGTPAAPKPLLHTFLHAPPPVLLELLNAAADDAATWARLGLLGPRTGQRAARVADWCWFLSTLVGLVENGVERGVIVSSKRAVESRQFAESMAGQTAKSQPRNTQIDDTEMEKLEKQDYWLRVHRAKLLMDLIFVSYDTFRIKRGKAAMQTFAGLASALLSSAKVYDRNRNSLVKSLRY